MSEVFGGGAYSVVRHNLVSGNGFVGAENQFVGLKWPIKLLEPPSVSVGMLEVFGGGAYSVVRHNLVSGNGFVGPENQCVGLVCALGLSDRRFPLRCR
ncbi:hypothetical protein QJS10_CPA16g00636 [Acorus calamus]|uniref:Right handed beta helix domain-containing protein n=1 Tax=Acorus calamus TaxID=4465 RepID=A0AAV9CX76_ACOCL|nr:hypothetical protein QJS10_CPA16g00636 [Acorus calamus]